MPCVLAVSGEGAEVASAAEVEAAPELSLEVAGEGLVDSHWL